VKQETAHKVLQLKHILHKGNFSIILSVLCLESQHQIINNTSTLLCTYLPKCKEAYICAIRIKQNPVQKESQPASWNFSARSLDCSDTFNLASCASETDHHVPFSPQQCFIHITLMKGTLRVCTLNIYKYIFTYNTILFTLHITV
jgi:hypothetical protein